MEPVPRGQKTSHNIDIKFMEGDSWVAFLIIDETIVTYFTNSVSVLPSAMSYSLEAVLVTMWPSFEELLIRFSKIRILP